MTVERCTGTTGTGTGTYLSTTFSCTVNGSTNYVQEWSNVQRNPYTHEAVYLATRKQSWCKFGADETTTVVVTRIAGPITSFAMRPSFPDVTGTIAGGVLTLTVPAGRQFRLDVNGTGPHYLTSSPLYIWSSMLQDAIPSGSVSWPDYLAANPGATFIPDNTKIHFPAGEWNVGALFFVGNNCTVHVDRQALVTGNWALEDGLADRKQGITFQGCGCLAYPAGDPTVVAGLAYNLQVLYAMFVSPFSSGADFFSSNVVRGVTMFAVPYHLAPGGITSWTDCQHLSYSFGGIGDSFSCSPSISGSTGTRTRVFCEAGDDAFNALPFANQTDTDCVVGTSLNGCWKLLYWAFLEDNGLGWQNLQITNCYAYHLGQADNDTDVGYPARGHQTVFHATCDALETQRETHGRFDVTIDGLTVDGVVASRIFYLANREYPYQVPSVDGDSYDVAGQIARFHINDLTINSPLGQKSIIKGKDRISAPHEIFFTRWTYNGVRVGPWNFRDYVELDSFAWRIYVEGHPMVTEVELSNQALSLLGQSGRITSLSPPDGSAEAEALQMFYDQAIDATLQMHPWSFAIKHVVLEASATANARDEWAYAYDVPEGLLRVLFILPQTTRQDFPDQWSEAGKDYAIELDEDDVPVLYTNMQSARCRYIKRITELSTASPLFIQAAAAHLASLAAGTLIKGNEGMAVSDRCLQRFSAYLAQAAKADSKHRTSVPQYEVPWLAARR